MAARTRPRSLPFLAATASAATLRRSLPAAVAFAVVASLALPAGAAAAGNNLPVMRLHEVPSDGAPEPTIGIPWDTDHVFFHSGTVTWRGVFDEGGNATWEDVTPPYQVPFNNDPMLHADPDTGRIWAGGLHGACSIMMMSDDDGETWVPAGNMCTGTEDDHQSIGSGPHDLALSPAHGHAAYYCAQAGAISCATSLDGGSAWLPFRRATGPCGGFHGHIRASPVTGTVAVPVPDCGGDHGFLRSTDGLAWESVTIPGSGPWTNGFDPSLQFTRGSGWMYYAMASENGIHVALSKDEGGAWEPLGQGHGRNDTWLDIGRLAAPHPIVSGVFANVQAGDDDRVAVSFLGLALTPGADEMFLTSTDIYGCEHERQGELLWNYYLATSFDAGRTWAVQRVSDDPVQVGGIWDVLIGGSGACRNLLDFNDMDLDSHGRIHIAFADGCTGDCAALPQPESPGWRDQAPRLLRQDGGWTLFARYDTNGTQTPSPSPSPPPDPTSEGSPPAGAAAVLAGLVLVAWARGRRSRA